MKKAEADKPAKKKRSVQAFKKTDYRWAVKIVIATFAISVVLTVASTNALRNTGYILAFSIIVAFILLGILFDIVGIAVTSASERPFHSMSARKTPGAHASLRLIRNADKVSNFCNDVVGDIAGIVSGTTSAIVVARLVASFSLNELLTQTIVSSLVASLTVGGKALGKSVAIRYNVPIIFFVGRSIHLLSSIKRRENDL